MFEHDRSAARGLMSTQGLIIFKHDSLLGNAPAHKLFELVKVQRKKEIDPEKPARSFAEYEIVIDKAKIPATVTLDARI
jgi:CRISPR-associated protein Csd2